MCLPSLAQTWEGGTSRLISKRSKSIKSSRTPFGHPHRELQLKRKWWGNFCGGRNVWQNTEAHKILSFKKGRREGEREKQREGGWERKMLPCYPSLTFFCPRWSCLVCASYPFPYWIKFLEESQLCKKKQLVWGTQTSAASFQALWFVAPVVRLASRPLQQASVDWLLGIGRRLRTGPQLGKWVWGGGLTKAKNWKQSVRVSPAACLTLFSDFF